MILNGNKNMSINYKNPQQMKRKPTLILAIFSMLLSTYTLISAYSIALQTATLYPEQRAIETLAKISNINGTEILPIQIKSYESVPKPMEFGGTLIPTKEIVAIPNKLIIMPGQEKVIRILYKGKKIKKEKIFFLSGLQLDIKIYF